MEASKFIGHLALVAILFFHPWTGLDSRAVSGAPTSQVTSSAPVTSSPTSPSSTTTSSSCFSPISTSSSWLESAGDWSSPCVPSSTSQSSSSGLSGDEDLSALWDQFFGSVSAERVAVDTVATLEEGADLANDLRKKILEVYLGNLDSFASTLEGKTLISGARDNATVANTTVLEVGEQYKRLSLALVYLEQCRHDQKQCDGNQTTLLQLFDDLYTKILQALCKLKGLFGNGQFPPSPPIVQRNSMPIGHRSVKSNDSVEMEELRHYRDYVVAVDVSRLLIGAGSALNSSDWSML